MINNKSITLEEWIIENEMDELREHIETHVEVLSNLEGEDDKASLVRMIMISVRQSVEDRIDG